MRIVATSDTHIMFKQSGLPWGDVLVHCGDITMQGTKPEVESAARWLREVGKNFDDVLFVPGNHDFMFAERTQEARNIMLYEGVRTLIDEPYEFGGVKFYGMPWTPTFGEWAFMLPRESDALRARCRRALLADPDVLITHGPAHGSLDRTWSGVTAGCEVLRDELAALPEHRLPKLHLFGHIHEGYGVQPFPYRGRMVVANVAAWGGKKPFSFDIEGRKSA